MRAARKVPQSTGAAVSGSTDEPPAAPRPDLLALRLLRCRQLRLIRKHGARPPVALSAYRRGFSYRRHCQGSNGRNVELRLSTPYKNEAASAHCCEDRGRRMIDAMKGTELPAAAPKQPSPKTEAQSRADEAEAVLWHSAQQIKSRTVARNISLNALR